MLVRAGRPHGSASIRKSGGFAHDALRTQGGRYRQQLPCRGKCFGDIGTVEAYALPPRQAFGALGGPTAALPGHALCHGKYSAATERKTRSMGITAHGMAGQGIVTPRPAARSAAAARPRGVAVIGR